MARFSPRGSREGSGSPAVGERRGRAPRIFLSYRREDSAGHAGRLYDAFVARFGSDHVFMDVDAIPPGARFGSEIESAVASCDVLIAVIGRGWLNASDAEGERRLDDPRDYVRREIEGALAAGLVVVPTCVQGAELPRPEQLPQRLADLTSRQAVSLTDAGWRDDVGRLIERLSAIRGPQAARARRRPAGRALLLAAGAVLAVVALAAGLTLSDGDPPRPQGDDRSASPEPTLTAAIPPGTRSSCNPPSSDTPGARVSIACDVASALTVTYHLFTGRDDADGWYRQERVAEQVSAGNPGCTRSDFHGEGGYEVHGRSAGRQFCRLDSDGRPVLWALDSRMDVGLEAGAYRAGRRAVGELLELWECCIRIRPPRG